MRTIYCIVVVCLLVLFSACVNTQKAIYFNDLKDSVLSKQIENIEPVIQKNDILQISVSSMNPEASASFNKLPTVGSTAVSTSPLGSADGYLVDDEGFLQFPFLGRVKAAGLTKKRLTYHLTAELTNKKLLVDPIITIRQTNFHVTVLGEVASPSVIPVPNEKINILEAIGLAGDLTIDARRSNVLLIREEEGKKIIQRIDLNSSQILTSPYYNLRSNDIVYVEPGKGKINNASPGRQLIPLIISSVSVAVLVLDRILQ